MDDLARAHALEHDWLRRLATTAAPVQVGGRVVGTTLLTAPVPRVRDHNAVLLDPAPELAGEDVADLLDAELGGRGVAHRRLYCDPDDADRWEQDLAGRGLQRADTVVLRWPGGTLDAPRDITIVEADDDLTRTLVRRLRADDAPDPAFVEQLVWLAHAQQAAGARVLAALDGDRPVGGVRVFPGPDAAQVEELDVHPNAQGRGLGRALLARALAVAGDVDLVVLTAEADDWPLHWYERLGLVHLGRSSGFVRPTDTTSA